jgi:hypothetical protein
MIHTPRLILCMNATNVESAHAPAHEWNLTRVAGSSITEAIGAIAAVVLAIIGLAGILSNLLASVATIVIGAAMLLEGVAYRPVASHLAMARGRGFTGEFFGGITGIVLGILALFGTVPQTLLAVALIVFGASFLLGNFEFSQWQALEGSQQQEAMSFGFVPGGHVLMGLGALVLGILAVIGLSPLTLILVGLLSLGTVALFNGIGAGSWTMSYARKS